MMSMFERKYQQEAIKAVTQTVKDAYAVILETAIEQIEELSVDETGVETKLKQIRALAVREVSRLSTLMKTNSPKEICENAVIAGVDEAITLFKAGEPII